MSIGLAAGLDLSSGTLTLPLWAAGWRRCSVALLRCRHGARWLERARQSRVPRRGRGDRRRARLDLAATAPTSATGGRAPRARPARRRTRRPRDRAGLGAGLPRWRPARRSRRLREAGLRHPRIASRRRSPLRGAAGASFRRAGLRAPRRHFRATHRRPAPRHRGGPLRPRGAGAGDPRRLHGRGLRGLRLVSDDKRTARRTSRRAPTITYVGALRR